MNRRGYKKPETIKILVCSGNLGNARPDLDSIDAWIPRDGYCRHVLESKYPVSLSSSMTSNSNNSIFSNGGAASQGEATTPPVPTIPRPFEQSLNSLLKQAKQTQHDIQTGKQQQHQQHHHSYNSSKQHDSRISMLTMNNRSSSSSDDFSKMDDLIASCIIEEDGVNISEHDESYDAFDSSLSLVNNEQFDIIVIGMQESTFDVVVDADSPTTPGEGFKTNANPLSPKEFNSAGLLSPKDILNPLLAVKAAKGVSNLTVKAAKGSAKKVTQAAKGSATIVSKAAKDSAKKVSNLTTAKDHTTLKKAMGGKSDDTHVLHDLLQEQLPSYSQATSYQRGEMRLIVLYQEDAIDLEVLSVKAQNTGRAGLANKGGIVTEVAVNQTTRLAFLTAHLEAHEGHAKYTTRCSTIADIFKGTESSVSSLRCDASISSHFMFVTGDLNFRTRLPDIEPGSPEHVELTHQLAYAKDYATLGKYDELSHALKKKDCLVGFQTPVCNFPPTFKVLRQEGYEYKDNRSPSYTDRILYLGADKLGEKIKVLGYEPIDTFSTSDHKPIRGAFELELNEKLKWRPVLANRFDRAKFGGASSKILGGKSMNPFAKKASTGRPSAAQKVAREKLHLFVSNISCELHPELVKDEPSPFVCFVSTPSEACQTSLSKLDNLRKKFRLRNMNTKNEDHAISRTTLGWPRTKKLKSTYQPDWAQEEIHFMVRTHGDTGMPIDLTGAMLHIAVFDGKGKAEARLIGTFTLNLAHLVNRSRERNRNRPQTASSRSLRVEPKSSHFMAPLNRFRKRGSFVKGEKSEEIEEPAAPKGVLTQGPSPTLQAAMHGTLFASRARKEAQAALNAEECDLSDLNIQALSLDEPLVKNGRELGRIQCTIDSWWMQEEPSMSRSRRFSGK